MHRARTTIADLLKPHAKALALGLLAVIGETAANLLEPWPLKIVLDNVSKAKPLHGWLNHLIVSLAGPDKYALVKFAALAVIGIAILGALCSYAEKYLTTSVGQWVMHDLRRTLYAHIQRLGLAYHDQTQTGDLISRVTSDIDAIQSFITSGLLSTLINGLTLVGMVAVMFYINWRFTLIALSIAPVLFVVVFRYTRLIKKASRDVRKKEGEIVPTRSRKMRRRVFLFLGCLILAGDQAPPGKLELPLKAKSVRFAVIGDSGTGEKPQWDVASQMARFHESFPFEFVLMLGDNIYGGKSAADFARKFEEPYKPLLDAGVKFYACLGNHDNPNERFYKPFNMGGQRYFSFKNGNAEFFALDSNYMDPQQLDWLKDQLANSRADWKICYFHHPLYTHSKFHGADTDLRVRIEPIFEKYGVNVVLAGHEHVYERLQPQKGIYYFVLGNAGELRYGNLAPSADTAKGFDRDRTFMLVEIAGDQFYFQTISRTGATVDSGVFSRQGSRQE